MPELHVDGQWRAATAGGRREIRCPADGTLVAEVDEATAEDTLAAVDAAHRAFRDGPWPQTSARERGDLLLRVADLLERDADAIARMESLDTGKRLVESEYDVADVVSVFRYYGRVAAEDAGRVVDTGNADVVSRIVHEPIGVCGLITPWNYPLLQVSWKVAPCLAAGNTFVLKPSELTPHSAIHLIRLLQEAGLPPGVGNLVLGAGPDAGAPLSEDPRVDLVSFTGGVATGRRIMAAAAGTVKKVALELGGKNPNIVFADADLDVALDFALTAVFLHSGQVCSAGARLLVEESVHDTFVDGLVERAGRIRLGGPFDDKAETGPLTSAGHRDKVEAYVAAGLAEGAVLRCGGRRPEDPALADGFYFLPTILDRCTSDMSVTQDESFGPVLTVETFSGEDDAVATANDSIYGLAGAVWTQDAGKAQRVAGRLRMG
ncbi:MAG TPA: aldehyde dehydrogenase family protein, partial [Nocardioides sp.]|nr:aldehyde dehydrogenase family protein [Nocardioides sp.]